MRGHGPSFFMKAIHKGADKEQSENGVSDTTTVTTGGIAISQTKPR